MKTLVEYIGENLFNGKPLQGTKKFEDLKKGDFVWMYSADPIDRQISISSVEFCHPHKKDIDLQLQYGRWTAFYGASIMGWTGNKYIEITNKKEFEEAYKIIATDRALIEQYAPDLIEK